MFTGTGLHSFAFLLIVILYNSLCLLKTEVSLMRGKDIASVEYGYVLHISKAVVVGSPLLSYYHEVFYLK